MNPYRDLCERLKELSNHNVMDPMAVRIAFIQASNAIERLAHRVHVLELDQSKNKKESND